MSPPSPEPEESPADVLFAMTGDFYRNSRALRQVEALADSGRTVRVLHFTEVAPSKRPGPQGRDGIGGKGAGPENGRVRVRDLERAPHSGPRFFWAVHRRMRAAAGETHARLHHASDLYVLPALAAARDAETTPLTFDSRELYPYVAGTVGRPWVRWFWKAVQRRYLPHTDAVFAVSDSIAGHLRERYEIPDPILVPNAPPRRPVRTGSHLRSAAGLPPERPVVLHQGSIQEDRGAELLVEAAARLEDAAVIFLGGGPGGIRLEELVRERGLDDRVRFVDRVRPDELLSVTAEADVGVSLLRDTCRNHEFALPNKLFEYLAAGVPVVVSDLPEMGGLVERFEVGKTVPPGDPDALARALRALIEDAGLRRRLSDRCEEALSAYSWEDARERWIAAFDALLAETVPAAARI